MSSFAPSNTYIVGDLYYATWWEDGIFQGYGYRLVDGIQEPLAIDMKDVMEAHVFHAWVELGQPDRSWIGKDAPLDIDDLRRMVALKNAGMEPRANNPTALAVAAVLVNRANKTPPK